MTDTLAPTLRLRNGVDIPRLGLGTWPMDDAEAAVSVADAIRRGYRLVDTAEAYRNERGVGEGVRRSGVPRAEIFVTTKFNREWHSVDGARTALDASLGRLGLDYVDLLLIHWPNPDGGRYVEAFDGIERLVAAGKVRAAGVSNFKPAHLAALFAAGFTPAINQIQLDPFRRRDDLVALHREHGIATESWSPLGRGGALLAQPEIAAIAAAHGRTPAQVVLRWQVQQGFVTVPKSSDPARQSLNLDLFGWALEPPEMAAIDALPQVHDLTDSDTFGH